MKRYVDIKKHISLLCVCGKTNEWELHEHVNYSGDMEPEGNGNYYYRCQCCGTIVEEKIAAQNTRVSMFAELIDEQEGFIASEKLGGNIVKQEFHKGALFGLRLAESMVLRVQQEAVESTSTSTNKPSVEISALLDKAFDLALDFGGNAELLTCIRLAQKLSHVG